MEGGVSGCFCDLGLADGLVVDDLNGLLVPQVLRQLRVLLLVNLMREGEGGRDMLISLFNLSEGRKGGRAG